VRDGEVIWEADDLACQEWREHSAYRVRLADRRDLEIDQAGQCAYDRRVSAGAGAEAERARQRDEGDLETGRFCLEPCDETPRRQQARRTQHAEPIGLDVRAASIKARRVNSRVDQRADRKRVVCDEPIMNVGGAGHRGLHAKDSDLKLHAGVA
jgi:hypothetical protein